MIIDYLKKGFWPFAGKIGTTLFSLFLVSLLTRYLSLADFGYYNLISTLFFLLMCDYGLTNLMLRELGTKENVLGQSSFFTLNYLLKIGAFCIGLLISLSLYRELVLPFVFAALGWALYYLQGFRNTILYAELRTFEATIGEILNKGSILLFSVLVLYLFHFEGQLILPLMVAFFLGNGLSYFYIHFATRDRRFNFLPIKKIGAAWRDFQPIFLLSLFGVVISRIDVLFLDRLVGPEAVGIFNLAERVRMSLVFIPVTFMALLTPKLAEATDKKRHIVNSALWRRHQFSLYVLTLGSSSLLVLTFICAPWIILLLVGAQKYSEFQLSITILRLLSISGFGVFLSFICQTFITVLNQQKRTVKIYGLALALKVAFLLIFVPFYGELGAALSDLLAYLVCGFGLLRLYYSVYRDELYRNSTAEGIYIDTKGTLKDYFSKEMSSRSPQRRILFVIDTLRADGAQVFLVSLAQKLRAEGYSVVVAAIVELGELTQELTQAKIPVFFIGKPGILSLSPLVKLNRIIRQFKPQILHTSLFAANTYGRIAGKLSGTNIIVSTVSTPYLEKNVFKIFIEKVLVRFNSCLIFPTPQILDYNLNRAKIIPNRTALIGNGVDTDLFYPREKDVATAAARVKKHYKLLSVGRLVPQEGHATLLEAISQLTSSKDKVEVHIVGEGELIDQLQRQVELMKLDQHVSFPGRLPRSKMPGLYRAYDLFILPSRSERGGLSLLEAMASGLPIIASQTGSIQNIITHDVNGWLVDPSKPSEFAQAIDNLLSHHQVRGRLAEQAYQDAQNRRLAQQLNHHIQIYAYFLGEQSETPNCFMD